MCCRREHQLGDLTLVELNPLLVEYARRYGFYSDTLVRQLENEGSLAMAAGVPDQAKTLFQTALEIAPDDHLRIQAAFQEHVDNAV